MEFRFVTSATIASLIAIYLFHVVTGEFDKEDLRLKPKHVFEPDEWYRFFTAPLVHNSFVYLVVVILLLSYYGNRLEERLGSALFLQVQFLAWILSSVAFVTLGLWASLVMFYSETDFLQLKHVGFGQIVLAEAVTYAFVMEKRDFTHAIAPWLLIFPMKLVSSLGIISGIAGAMTGLLISKGIGYSMCQGKDKLQRWDNFPFQSSWVKVPFSEVNPLEISIKSELFPAVGYDGGSVSETVPLV